MAASISSQAMTVTLVFRNEHGAEENYFRLQKQEIDSQWRHFGRVVVTEFGVALIFLIAAVETVAYSILAGMASVVSPENQSYFYQLLQSSSFTLVWSGSHFLAANFLGRPNVFTREAFARFWFGESFKFLPYQIYRLQDDLEIFEWEKQYWPEGRQNPLLAPYENDPSYKEAAIEAGAQFLVDRVLKGLSEKSIEDFREWDPTDDRKSILFIMVRVFFIYIAESKPHDFIPFFFSRRAKSEIVQIRQAMIDPAILNELQDIYQNIDQFQKKPTSSQAQEVDKQLRAAASKELQCALLALLCWGKAIEKVGGLLY